MSLKRCCCVFAMRRALRGTEARTEQLLLGDLIESLAESSRKDPFESVFPSCLSVIESVAIYRLN